MYNFMKTILLGIKTYIDKIAESFKTYIDKIAENLDETKANQSDLSSHTIDTIVHITNDERESWNKKAGRIETEGQTVNVVANGAFSSYTIGKEAESFNGTTSQAIGDYSHAEGYYTKAIGDSSHAEGYRTETIGGYSHAEGWYTVASGEYSHAEGYNTKAIGNASHAEGHNSQAIKFNSHAEGSRTTASGDSSHAEGCDSEASGYCSHAEGDNTIASGDGSHAEGWETIAKGHDSHVQGKYNIEDTSNTYAHIVGNGTANDARSNAHTLDWGGNAWYQGDVYIGGTGQDDENAKKLATEKYISEKVGGTVEITSGDPEKENTVLTINPDVEEVNVYTVEEIDEIIASIDGGVFNGDASSIPYDDTETQFGVNNIQDAISQIIENLKSLSLSYNNNILYLSLDGVVISSCTIVPTVVGSISSDNTISIDNLQSGVYTLKYENDTSILDDIENICELEVI